MIARKIIYLDSTNASIVDLSQGYAKFQFPQPLESFGSSCKICVHSFSYTNFFQNVSAPNNEIFYSDDPLQPTKYSVVIPPGSYGITDFADFVSQSVLSTTGLQIFRIEPNYSTGKLSIVFNMITGWFVNMTATRPPILGFGIQHIPASDSNPAFYAESAPDQASFNSITQIKIKSNLSQDSIDNSNLSSNVIFVSTPKVQPGSVQNDTPYNMLTVESALLTSKCSSIDVYIVDQMDRPVLMSEHFQITLLVL